ncbi:nuclear receptor 2C2-associated protein [Thrips palmi]|uniref:Nuclear receptor 2C2-associated protein n=1 Tax=Thrips palmi TaxID=161013 RepID=A0A6P8ZQI1_THRPL|nr:nuclear receptor 2C2-associated protein [Thrips palmi]
MTSIFKGNFECKVSSVLNKDVKQFGKKNMFDGSDETCWNSDQGTPQYISVLLDKEEEISKISIQFQGGFVGQDCWLSSVTESGEKNIDVAFYPEDINSVQTFDINPIVKAKKFTVAFNKSTDFFGRIVVYKFDAYSPH